MRAIGLALCALLAGCGGRTLISPGLEQGATRAALRASMAADEVATPQDDVDVLALGDTGVPGVALPVHEPPVGAAFSEDAAARAASVDEPSQAPSRATPAAEGEVADAATAAGDRLRGDGDDPALARALEQLTAELREQRMLTTMRLVAGERAADDSAAPAPPSAELERAVTRLEAAQEAQVEDTAALAEAVEALRALVEERMPSDVAARLGEVREAVREVTPALEAIQREQEALRAQIERLESASTSPAPEPAPAAQSFSLDELREALDAESGEADESPPDDEEPQDAAPEAEGDDQAPQDADPEAEGDDEATQDAAPEAEGDDDTPQEGEPEVDDETLQDTDPDAEGDDDTPQDADPDAEVDDETPQDADPEVEGGDDPAP